MGRITSHMFDLDFVEQALTYLAASWQIEAVIVDIDGQPVPLGPFRELPAGPATRHYSFDFPQKIGGLLCGGVDQASLDRAAPHITVCLQAINAMLARERELSEASDEILQLSNQLHFLYNLAGKVIGISNLREFCTIILQEISLTIGADGAFIVTKGQNEEQVQIRWNLPEDEMARLAQSNSFGNAAWHNHIIFDLEDGTSVLSAPLLEKDGVSGHLAFLRGPGRHVFTSYDKKFLGIINNIISPSIETLRLYDSLQQLYVNTVKALAMAIDAKDRYTHGHSYRVAKYAVAIGRKLNIAPSSLNDLEIAAYMHDLGKIGIPEAILGKPGRLTDAEYDKVKEHPLLTDKILEPISLPSFIVEAALQHHERLDGGGYPCGLKGDSISGFARIIAVADVFDAMTSARPYRDAMPVEQVLEIICTATDREFDRNMVRALLEALQDEQADPELTMIYRDLHFADVQSLNQFLLGLGQSLAPVDAPHQNMPTPAPCTPLSRSTP